MKEIVMLTTITNIADSMASEAAKKFWGCPELMENLLPFLDTYSIICLAKVHMPVQDIVLGKTVWNKLIRQVCLANTVGNRRMTRGHPVEERRIPIGPNRRMISIMYYPDNFDLEKEFTQMKIQVFKQTC